jgi:hypothetical protein
LEKNHFHLLPTRSISRNALSQGLMDNLKGMNHILKYGEFLHPEYEPLNRWGGLTVVQRSYKIYPPTSVIDSNEKPLASIFTKPSSKPNYIDISTKEGEQRQIDIKIKAGLMADKAQGITPSTSSMPVDLTKEEIDLTKQDLENRDLIEAYMADVAKTTSTEMSVVPKDVSEEKDTVVNLFKILIPNVLFMLKDKNYNHDIKFQTINLLKGYYDNNKGKINNNSILTPILSPDNVIDLTELSVHQTQENSSKSPNKRKLTGVKKEESPSKKSPNSKKHSKK